MLPFKLRRVQVSLPERNLTRLFFFATAKLNTCCRIDHHFRCILPKVFNRERKISPQATLELIALSLCLQGGESHHARAWYQPRSLPEGGEFMTATMRSALRALLFCSLWIFMGMGLANRGAAALEKAGPA